MNVAIEESLNIWREFHAPSGVTLAESKEDWLDLLDGDPTMMHDLNWGDLAGAVTAKEITEFRTWLEESE